ncbi:MAG: hypothetical protein OEY28_02775 [Nitrospira sp.]|nr:hypothetical protein [Nitrospira sp.]
MRQAFPIGRPIIHASPPLVYVALVFGCSVTAHDASGMETWITVCDEGMEHLPAVDYAVLREGDVACDTEIAWTMLM